MNHSASGPERSVAAQADDDDVAGFLPAVPLPKRLPLRPIPIADMANFFGVTHRTLHFYEEKKLLQPTRSGAMRIYSPRQVKVMALVTLCREIGMPIAQIQELMAELNAAGSKAEADAIFHAALGARRKELAAEASLIRRQMQQIAVILDQDGGSEAGSENRPQAPILTDIEYRCLGMMAEGYIAARIAAVMRMPLEEVIALESGIVQKFGSTNRFQAVAKAVLLGIIGD
jgi:DNA-binding transcriptional MerR regulator